MAQTINADDGVISGSAGLKSSSDGTAILSLQTKGTTALTVDGSQNVGIGTSSPAQKLDVNGTIAIGGTKFFSKITSDSYIWNNTSALNFVSSDGNTVQMKLDSSGNLGLGVTPSAWQSNRRVVQVGANGGALWGINSGAGTCFLSNNTYYDGTNYKYINTANATYYAQASDGKHEWYVAASGTAGNNITSFTQAMTLNASGDLLLQAAAPNFYIQPSTTTSNALTRCINTGGTLYVGLDSSAGGLGGAYTANFWHSGNYAMVFATNNTERARITAAGELMVGTTGPNAGERLHVKGAGNTASTYNCYFENSGGSRVFSFEDAGKFTTGTLADSPYNLVVGATNRDLFVDNAGAIGYVSSVRASKTNITPVSDTDWLLQLNPVTFNFRKKDADGNYTDEADGPVKHGLIAEEVEAVNADLCFYDDEDKGGALRGVNYSHLITPMLKLIQKQQAAIAALEAKVAALEAK